MASTLTTAQTLTLFTILETPYSSGFKTVDGMGVLSADVYISQNSQAEAKTAILNYLDTLSTAVEDVLKDLISKFDAIGLNTGRLSGGGVGDVQGVDFDFDRKRALIKERVQVLVPFYKQHEVVEKRMKATSGAQVMMIR